MITVHDCLPGDFCPLQQCGREPGEVGAVYRPWPSPDSTDAWEHCFMEVADVS